MIQKRGGYDTFPVYDGVIKQEGIFGNVSGSTKENKIIT